MSPKNALTRIRAMIDALAISDSNLGVKAGTTISSLFKDCSIDFVHELNKNVMSIISSNWMI